MEEDLFQYCHYSTNDYDEDGDLVEEGIYLHFGPVRIQVAENLIGFNQFIKHLQSIKSEIEENYSSCEED
jgi:hypothetical protein